VKYFVKGQVKGNLLIQANTDFIRPNPNKTVRNIKPLNRKGTMSLSLE
jgi:hypothetical protein